MSRGGNYLFDALHYTLSTLPSLPVPVPPSNTALRETVMRRVIEKHERWNVCSKEDIRLLRRLIVPGTPVFQGVLIVVSELFKLTVHVFFGLPTPLTYRGKNVKVDASQIELQCLGGVHYNAVVMTDEFLKNGGTPDTEVRKMRLPDTVDEDEIDAIEDFDGLQDMTVMTLKTDSVCSHSTRDLSRY